MLTAIEIENFKGFKSHTRIELKNLSLFSGMNSAGKSTIAQVLLLISQSMRNSNFFLTDYIPSCILNGDQIKLGKPDDILNDVAKELKIALFFEGGLYIKYEFQLKKITSSDQRSKKEKLELVKFELYTNSDEKYISFINKDGEHKIKARQFLTIGNYEVKEIFGKFMNDQIADESITFYRESVEFQKWNELLFSGLFLHTFLIDYSELKNCIKEEYVDLFEKNINKFKEVADKHDIDLENIAISVTDAEKIFGSFIVQILPFPIPYIAASRDVPLRIYSSISEIQNPFLEIMEHWNDATEYKYDFEKKEIVSGTVEEAFNYWMCEEFKMADKIHVVETVDGLVSEIFLEKNNKKITINNVGFGISQILPILVQCLRVNDFGIQKSLIVIDEPESHLHPGMQTKIGFFLLNMAFIHEDRGLIVETHSEHIINIINYYSLKYPLIKERLASYWVYKDEKDNSKIETITVDEYGFFINPPNGFYDETEKISNLMNNIREEKLLG